MTARNPKDLKQMVAASQQDMDEMQLALSKLRNLSADDTTEAAMLRSRIEEQSSLIMILKRRADETLEKNVTLERVRDELESFRDHAQEELDREFKKYRMLEDRFNDLASNHVEMIKFKDQYKQMNETLRRENTQLREDNDRLFSKAIVDRDDQISVLTQNLTNQKQIALRVETRYQDSQKALEAKYWELQESLKARDDKFGADIKALQCKLRESEERLKGVSAKLKYESDLKASGDQLTLSKMEQLKKEKDEMLDLAMQRGKLVQEKVSDNKKLQTKLTEMEKSVREMQLKFEREEAAVNANLQVRKLRGECETAVGALGDLERQFVAYKKHANTLLQQEKDLNAKLRLVIS